MFTNSIPTDSITVGAFRDSIGTSTLVSGTDTKTIVTIGIAANGKDEYADLYCGNVLIARQFTEAIGVTPTNIHCKNSISLVTTKNTTKASAIINYVPYDTSLISTSTESLPAGTSTIGNFREYDGPNFNEWLFVAGVIIFIMSFSFWGKINFFRINKK